MWHGKEGCTHDRDWVCCFGRVVASVHTDLAVAAAWGWQVSHKCQAGCTWVIESTLYINIKNQYKEGKRKASQRSGYFSCKVAADLCPALLSDGSQDVALAEGDRRHREAICLPVKGTYSADCWQRLVCQSLVSCVPPGSDNLKCWMNKSTPCQLPSVSLAWSPDAS